MNHAHFCLCNLNRSFQLCILIQRERDLWHHTILSGETLQKLLDLFHSRPITLPIIVGNLLYLLGNISRNRWSNTCHVYEWSSIFSNCWARKKHLSKQLAEAHESAIIVLLWYRMLTKQNQYADSQRMRNETNTCAQRQYQYAIWAKEVTKKGYFLSLLHCKVRCCKCSTNCHSWGLGGILFHRK